MSINARPTVRRPSYHERTSAAYGIRGAAVAAIAAALFAGPALAEETTVHQAIEAASLHEGPLDMVAYYVPVAGGALEVTATFATREVRAEPMRIVMALGDGDDVAFAMPGHPQSLYRFVRAGDSITVSVRPVPSAVPASF
jgi:hypothetical protein